jgi:hypothetical protein
VRSIMTSKVNTCSGETRSTRSWRA